MTALQAVRLLGDWVDGRPAYVALASAFRALITDDRLPVGTRIPSERSLATHCGISRNTVTAAFGLLRAEGYLEGARGAGSVTAFPGEARRPRPAPAERPAGAAAGARIDLATDTTPDPGPLLTDAVHHAAAQLGGHPADAAHSRVGLYELREAIAAHYGRRGLPTTPGEVMITTGAYQGWGLLLRLMARRFEPVLVDSPTDPDALHAIRSIAGRPLPVGLGPQGWDPDLVGSALRQARPVLAYLMPDHHRPTGHLMSDAARRQVVSAARSSATVLVADETLADLTLDGTAAAPLACYGNRGEVVSIGSLSPVLWSGLDLGWIRASATVIGRLARLRGPGDAGNSLVNQLIACRLFESHDALLTERRTVLRTRRDALVEALRALAPDWRFTAPRGGLSLWVDLGERIGSRLAAAASTHHGVDVLSGSRFAVEGSLDGFVRLPYVQPADVLAEGVRNLVRAAAHLRGPQVRESHHQGPRLSHRERELVAA
ncbi:aminotransferase-like domain-containing protein [Streptacidiphilus rugosus]|uniref:aminotransferase-like domain-containing protein n=1 Tax=Streptacidiphilus rugosus TaxID=405783 RepID=UPI0007C6E3B0|nr:PLP-dependent aminotransferase family protein [Streptacidiphilus rugosus]